jgi:hypothetical protein
MVFRLRKDTQSGPNIKLQRWKRILLVAKENLRVQKTKILRPGDKLRIPRN